MLKDYLDTTSAILFDTALLKGNRRCKNVERERQSAIVRYGRYSETNAKELYDVLDFSDWRALCARRLMGRERTLRKGAARKGTRPERAGRREPLEKSIEHALAPGQFVAYRRVGDFVADLEKVVSKLEDLVGRGESERATALYEILIAACHEKAEELDDSGGEFGGFVEDLFCGWLKARQDSGSNPHETAEVLVSWMDEDPYGFCHHIEKRAVQILDKAGLSALEEIMLERLLSNDDKAEDSTGPGDDFSYRRRRAADILKEVYAAKRNADAYINVCERTELSPKDCENIAGIFRKRRKLDDALSWVERGIALEEEKPFGKGASFRLPEMKRELLRKLGRVDEALDSAWAAFRSNPGVYAYEELMKYVSKARRLDWHRKAMNAAEKAPLDSLIQLCVEKKELDHLAAHIRRAGNQELEQLSHYTAEPAAKQLAGKHPDLAAKLNQALGLRILAAKKSKYYDVALRHFERAKERYVKAGLEERWKSLAAEVQKKHKRKYSFMPGFMRIVSGEKEPAKPSFAARSHSLWKKRGRR